MEAFAGDALDSDVLGPLYDHVELQKDKKKLRKKRTNKASQPENGGFGYFGYLNSEGGCRDGMCRAVQWHICL